MKLAEAGDSGPMAKTLEPALVSRPHCHRDRRTGVNMNRDPDIYLQGYIRMEIYTDNEYGVSACDVSQYLIGG